MEKANNDIKNISELIIDYFVTKIEKEIKKEQKEILELIDKQIEEGGFCINIPNDDYINGIKKAIEIIKIL